MKTSKIIFISLISTTAFLIVIAFVDIKINSHRHQDTTVNRQILPSFKVIYISNCNFDLIQNDSSFIETTCLKDSPMPGLNYSMKGDTLMVSDKSRSHKKDGFPTVRICATDSLKSLILKNSDITFKCFKVEKMNLNMNNSSVWLNQDKKIISSFRSLDILAKNHSSIYSNEFKIEDLSINLQKSEVNLEIITNKINGTLSDSSRVSIRQALEISLKTDSTSKAVVNDY
jgi:hypothetical protein